MSLRIKLMAAAVAMAASAGASADMSNIQSGNSSLAFVALDSTGSPISVMMDLRYTLDQFLPTLATTTSSGTIQWNFNTNSLLVNGVAQSGNFAWSDNLASFNANAQATETRWGVIAGDSLSTASSTTPIRYLSTSLAPIGTVDNQTLANLSGFSAQNNLYNANNLIQTDGVVDGSTATSGAAYVGQTFGATGNWANKTNGWLAFASEGATQNFYSLVGTPAVGAPTLATVTQYAGTFTYDDGVLTYAVAAVPEPETYAMLLAGLGMIGAIARRRKNA